MEFTDSEKHAILSVLTLIMEADTIIHPKEVEFMDEIMRHLNICVQDLDYLEVQDFHYSKSIILAMSAQKQAIAKDWFIQMSECDGYVDPRETEIIESVL